ncbi:MAG TPA: WYL domain-containing protein [Anaeromyxobacteraceae bacterium]|nr:WYL domain-containing protein [Anaeromyxobacteraceae bacterium]
MSPVDKVRKLLLLIPAAWRAQPRGLPLQRAVRITGARDAREIEELVAAAGSFDVGPSAPEDFLAVSVENGRVVVDRPLRFVAPPPLSFREGAALMAALRPFERDAGPAVGAVLRKLRRAVPDPFRARAEELSRSLDFQVAPPGPWAERLSRAIEQRVEVAVDYRNLESEALRRRTLEPRLLLHHDGHWYLAAWDVEKAAEHLYRLDRMAAVEPGTRAFAEHRGPPAERYRTRHLYFQSGGEREVTVRFSGTAATGAREQWSSWASLRPDGSVAVTTRVAPGNYLVGWVLGYGGQAEIESPPEARALLAERVAELRELYTG